MGLVLESAGPETTAAKHLAHGDVFLWGDVPHIATDDRVSGGYLRVVRLNDGVAFLVRRDQAFRLLSDGLKLVARGRQAG